MAAHDLIEKLPRHLKLGELRVFVAVLEHRSFRRAAAAIHITQPAVTKAIAGLEAMLGVKLFDRSAIGVEPTIHGLSFAPHAVAVFSELRTAAQDLDIVSSGARGTLHVGTVPMPALSFLPVAIRQLVGEHPRAFITVVDAREQDLAERLRKREVEIAIFRLALFDPGEDLEVLPLFEERLCVLASRDHPLAARRKLEWSDLLQHPWVLPPADSYFVDHVRRSFRKLDLELPRHAVESMSIHMQYAMVLHGSMLSFGLRSQVANHPSKDLLVRLPVPMPSITGTIGAVSLRGREHSPLAQKLLGHIKRLAAGH